MSCGSCGKLRVWDVRSASPEALRICAHDDEAISCSFDFSHEHRLISASLDRSIRLFDRRFVQKGGGDGGQTATPMLELSGGHGFGARRIRSHPHRGGIFGSVGEEGHVIIWEQHDLEQQSDSGGGGRGCSAGLDGGSSVVAVGDHSEATTAIDFSVLQHERAVTCGWDGKLRVWDLDA